MTIFDQRGQTVTYQYNIAGDIDLSAVQSQADLIEQLEKLQAELAKAVQGNVFDEDTATDVEYQVKKAVQQARKPEPDKKTILDHLSQAKDLITQVATTVTAAAGLVTAFDQAVQIVQKLF